MKRWTSKSLCGMLGLASGVLMVAPGTVFSQESIAFNAVSTPVTSSGTSKLENTTADVLGGSNVMTICVWVYAAGPGENGGTVVALDEADSGITLSHSTSASQMFFRAKFATSPGVWSFPVPDNCWNAVAISYNKSNTSQVPVVRVNFTDVTENLVETPAGTAPSVNTGDCVGNIANQTSTWNGRIAHLQFFDRILSASEMDNCSRTPGSVTTNQRMWLPMTKASDVFDRTGNGFHGIGTDLENGGTFPPFRSVFHFGVTNQTLGQLVIASNGNEPAGGVIGQGDRTKLTADAGLTGGARFIVTEGFGSQSMVMEPTVRDLFLFGNQNIPNEPFGNENPATSPVCHAVTLDGDAPTVMNCKIFDFRGDGVLVQNSTQPASRQPRVPRVQGNRISHVYTGIRAVGPDTQISGNRVANVRDQCLLVTSGAGNCQSDGNHYFGASTAIKVESGAGAFRSLNDTFSDAAYGFQNAVDGLGTQIDGGFTQHCWVRNIVCRAQTSITNTVVRVSQIDSSHPEIIGVEWPRDGSGNAERSSFIGGAIYTSIDAFPMLSDYAASTAGMKIDAYATEVRTMIIGEDEIGNEKGIWVPSAIQGGNFHINVAGFQNSGDRAVYIESADIKGTTWIIECSQGDQAVHIPTGWDSSNSFTIIRRFPGDPPMIPPRVEKTMLTPGQSYDQ